LSSAIRALKRGDSSVENLRGSPESYIGRSARKLEGIIDDERMLDLRIISGQ